MSTPSPRYPWFVRKDLDGFFGLFVDNIVQLLLIVGLCQGLCGMTGEAGSLLWGRILPGAAVSILVGNLFYAWQARRLAIREGRDDVTALPYGINTPSLLVYIFFVMAPVYSRATGEGMEAPQAARLAWQMGLIACLGSGLIEFLGAFVAEWVRRQTPRAALLSTLAGIAIGFIAMTFALQIYHKPLIAMVPLAAVLITYFSSTSFPLGLPGGLVAVGFGTASAWLLTALVRVWPEAPAWVQNSTMNPDAIGEAVANVGLYLPAFAGPELAEVLRQPASWLGFLSVIVPMGLFNLVGSLQNIESAEAGGDSFDTRSSLAVNGLGTICAALFGSCFPTTIYIGHPGWKALGARSGYSTLNGVVITAICLSGTVALINSIVPLEAGVAIVLWIGIIITAQAFSATPPRHASAVAIGLFPAIAAWGQTVMQGAFLVAGGKTMQELLTANPATQINGFLLQGLISLERGYIFTCMILSAISAFLIDRKFGAAAAWSFLAAVLAFLGLTHAYQLQGNIVDYLFVLAKPASETAMVDRAEGIAIGYLMVAIAFLIFGRWHRKQPEQDRIEHS
jgi:AGZA family xanthine/uracil permease-like MFS transporter